MDVIQYIDVNTFYILFIIKLILGQAIYVHL